VSVAGDIEKGKFYASNGRLSARREFPAAAVAAAGSFHGLWNTTEAGWGRQPPQACKCRSCVPQYQYGVL